MAQPSERVDTDDLPREIAMFLVGDDGAPLAHDTGADDATQPSLATRLGLAPTQPEVAAIDQTTLRLTPGARVGQAGDAPRRSGFPEEILVTLHADPGRAAECALDTDVLDRAPGRLRIDENSLRARRNELRWSATLRCHPWAKRPAFLRLYASPSANVTVLTLSPVHPHRIATRSFLRIGLRTMSGFRDQLADRLAGSAVSRPPSQ